jgi:hypothetical protein
MARSATGGLKFTSPAAARAHADRMEQLADDQAAKLRQAGKDAQAEQLVDRSGQQAQAIRAAADGMEASSPKPKSATSKAAAPTRKAQTSKHGAATSRTPATARTPSSGRRARRLSLPRLPRAATAPYQGYGALGWQAAGLTLGLAALTVFVASKKGPGTFSAITGTIGRALALILDPVDPLSSVGSSLPPDPYSAADTAVLNQSP